MNDLVTWPPTWATLFLLPGLLVGFTVHELAHALVAYLLGDTSQVERRRLTFNPLRHVSWLGLIVFLLFGFGWAKPVWVDHSRLRMRNRAFGTFLVSISGATANLLLALAVLLGVSITTSIAWLYAGVPPSQVEAFLKASPGPDAHGIAISLSHYVIVVNLALAFFNLIPLPPLDGFQALVSLVMAVRTALGRAPVAARRPVQPIGPGPHPPEAVPQSPARIHFDIALEYQRAGELDEAIVRYRQATEHDPNLALAYYNLGLAYWAKGRMPLAISSFRAAVKSGSDPAVQFLAERQLQALLRAQSDPTADVGPPAPPLAMAEVVASVPVAPEPLNPEVSRRLWLRLAAGGLLAGALTVAAWAYVTVVTIMGAG